MVTVIGQPYPPKMKMTSYVLIALVGIAFAAIVFYITHQGKQNPANTPPKSDLIDCSDPVNYNVCHNIKDLKGA